MLYIYLFILQRICCPQFGIVNPYWFETLRTKKTISAIVDYTIKSRQLNPTTVIYVVDVELLDGGKVKIIGVYVFLYPPSNPSVSNSTIFWKNSFERVLITNAVLRSIGAFELMKFQNRIKQLDFSKQQQTALNIFRDYIISKGSAVIEHYDLLIGDAIFNNEPNLAMFRYKNTNEPFMSHEELHNIKMQNSKGVFKSLYLINIFRHNIYYFIV